MPKYLFYGSYTTEGYRGVLVEGGTSRREKSERWLAALGARLEAYYLAFGDPGFYIIVDVPDSTTAVAIALAVNSGGAVNVKAVPLVELEEVDAAIKLPVGYQPPGR